VWRTNIDSTDGATLLFRVLANANPNICAHNVDTQIILEVVRDTTVVPGNYGHNGRVS